MSIQSMEYNQSVYIFAPLASPLFHSYFFFFFFLVVPVIEISAIIYHVVSPYYFSLVFSLNIDDWKIIFSRSDCDFIPVSTNYRTVEERTYFTLGMPFFTSLFSILRAAASSHIFPSLYTVSLSFDVSTDAASREFSTDRGVSNAKGVRLM